MRGTAVSPTPTVPQSGPATEVDLVRVDPALASEWDRLAETIGAHVFLRPGWVCAWAEAFAGGELLAVTARRGRDLVGLLPVLEHGRRLRSATNSETSRFAPVLADPAAFTAMLARLEPAPRRVSLQYIPADHPAVTAAHSAGGRLLLRRLRRSPYVDTASGDYDGWERAHLSGSRRHNLRRHERRLRDLGELTFSVEDGRGDLDALLQDGFRIEAAGWKGRGGTAVLSRPPARRFYWSAARWLAAAGKLQLAFLRLDGRPIAFSYGLEDRGVVASQKLAFDEGLRQHGPGILAVRSLLQACFADPGVQRFDFLGEAAPYKMVFADGTESQVRLDYFPPTVVGAAERVAMAAGWRLRDEVSTRVPLAVRERIDLTSPARAMRSIATVAGEKAAARRAP